MDIRLLLVEENPGDERLVREMLAETLGPSYVLESVDTLANALARLDANDTDLVLLDLSLPDSTGIDTLSKVQARAPGVPIVVLTGSRDDDLAIQSIRMGVQDFLLKGQVDAGILRLALHAAFERRRGLDVVLQSEDQWRALTLERIDTLLSRRAEVEEGSAVAGPEAEASSTAIDPQAEALPAVTDSRAEAPLSVADPQANAEAKSTVGGSAPITADRVGLLRLVMVLGVILAVSSAGSPWYISGDLRDSEMTATQITFQTMGGWSAFPGLPLLLIILGSASSAILTIVGAGAQGYRVASMAGALVSLFSATWLWYGLVGSLPSGDELFTARETGPMLVTIGSILLVGGGAIRIRAMSHP